ncbi:tyrosine recombinase XerC [uncultured Litoreibacter sp.]|uniref:site-specific integrase n=1 Tax=uncultured Litoreibacter sp. TaxID=1392394 RepID=UPI002639A5E3|nr:site-specific integrase [uncultured Litoreibacter sp.]
MTKRNSDNTRIKVKYFAYLRGPQGLAETTVEKAAASLTLFETVMGYKDFKRHNLSWPERFKEVLGERTGSGGATLSVSTQSNHMRHVRSFIKWLSDKPGYKSRIGWSDANYYTLSRKDERVAAAQRDPIYPLLGQALKAFRSMPSMTELQRRDRAIIAFLIMTGARVKATTTLKLKRVSLSEKTVAQDPRDVETKGSKTFVTAFYIPVPDLWDALSDWIVYLYEEKNFGPEDPLFPKNGQTLDENGNFISETVIRAHWSQTGSIRQIVRNAFLRLHMPAYGPHSFRHMLTHVALDVCKTPRDLKAWSQNFGHSDVMTTLSNYGKLTSREQIEQMQVLYLSGCATNPTD